MGKPCLQPSVPLSEGLVKQAELIKAGEAVPWLGRMGLGSPANAAEVLRRGLCPPKDFLKRCLGDRELAKEPRQSLRAGRAEGRVAITAC